MKILVTTASPWSGLADAAVLLAQAGLRPAQPAPVGPEQYESVSDWHSQLLQTLDLDPQGLNASAPLVVGKLWEDMAVGLLRANLGQADWFLADTRATWVLDFWGAIDPQARFLLLYLPAEAALQAARQQAVADETADTWDPTPCAQAWLQHNRQLLRLAQAQPQRSLLVNTQQAVLHPQRLLKTLDTALGVQISPGNPLVDWDPPVYLPAPIEALVAPALAAELRAMNRQLREAQTPLLSGGTQLVISSQADADAHKGTGLLGWLGKGKQAEQALASLGSELAHTQADLGHAQDIMAALAAQKDRLQTRLAQVEEARRSAQDALAQAQASAQKKSDELTQSHAELAAAHAHLQQLQTELTHATEQAQQTAEQAHIQQQAHTHQVAELQQENELLLQQLHQVQEELEKFFHEREALKQQLATAEQGRAQAEQAKGEADKARADADKARTEADKKATTLSQQAQAAKAAQDQAEQARTAAEKSKTQAEQAKNQADKARADAEKASAEAAQALANAQKKNTELAQQLATLQAREIQQAQALKEAQQESELLLQQLHQVQEELEKFFHEREALKQQLAAAEQGRAQAEQAKTQAEKARADAEWGRAEAAKAQAEVQKRATEMAQQLHHAQEELERHIVKEQEAQQAHAGTTDRLNRLLQRLPTWADAAQLSGELVANEPLHQCLRIKAQQVWIAEDVPLAEVQFLFGVRGGVPYLEFRPGEQGVPHSLLPWPSDLADEEGPRLLLAPKGPPPLSHLQSQLVVHLSTSQWRLVRGLLVLVGSHIGRLGAAAQADRALWADAARKLTQQLEELSPGLHHEGLEILAVAQPQPGLETIRLALKQVSTKADRIPLLVFELGLQFKLIRGQPQAQTLFLEFRQWRGGAMPFAGWMPNGEDEQGSYMRVNYRIKGKSMHQPRGMIDFNRGVLDLISGLRQILPGMVTVGRLSKFMLQISPEIWVDSIYMLPTKTDGHDASDLDSIIGMRG